MISQLNLFSSFSDILQILEFKSNSLVFREGTSAWFDLQIQSNAAYEIRWFHNEDLITSSSTRYRITSFEHENGTSSHSLHVNNVLLRDKGKLKVNLDIQVFFLNIAFKFVNILYLKFQLLQFQEIGKSK